LAGRVSVFAASALVLFAQPSEARYWEAVPIVVHEWGVNVFDWSGGVHDPQFPGFCYTDEAPGDVLGQPEQRARDLPPDSGIRTKPVLYFYLPEHDEAVAIDVETRFAFGRAAAWYPQVSVYRTPAEVAEAEPIDWEAWRGEANQGRLRNFRENVAVPEDERFELVWNGLTLNSELPQGVALADEGLADDHWWSIARDVPGAAYVSNGSEAERFLFYEGATRELPAVAVVNQYTFNRAGLSTHLVNVSDETIYDVLVIYRAPDGRRWVGYQSELQPMPVQPAADAAQVQLRVAALAIPDFAAMPADQWIAAGDDKRFEQLTNGRVYEAMLDGGILPAGFLMRDPADPQPATVTHALFPREAEVVLEIWQADFFDAPGLTILYRESPAYLDRAMPLHIFSDMYHYVDLSRCGWVLNQNVPINHVQTVHDSVTRLIHENWQDTPEGRQQRKDGGSAAGAGVAGLPRTDVWRADFSRGGGPRSSGARHHQLHRRCAVARARRLIRGRTRACLDRVAEDGLRDRLQA